jgi:hypothetical protein
MTPRPFYRWKSFWLGLCVLLFLGWAWAETVNQASGITWVQQRGHYGFQIMQFRDSVTFWHGEGVDGRGPGFYCDIYPLKEEKGHEWFPEALVLERSGTDSGVLIAQWLFILLFIIAWGSWLFFHWKREQKKSAP